MPFTLNHSPECRLDMSVQYHIRRYAAAQQCSPLQLYGSSEQASGDYL